MKQVVHHRSKTTRCSGMKFPETRGLHIYSTPPALNVKYLNLTRSQLPTPQSAMFNLGSKKPGSDRKERDDAKMSFFTVFCLEIFSSFTALLFKHMKTNKTGRFLLSTAKGIVNVSATPGNPCLLLYIHQKH